MHQSRYNSRFWSIGVLRVRLWVFSDPQRALFEVPAFRVSWNISIYGAGLDGDRDSRVLVKMGGKAM
jgi:hypothetical protein